MKLVAWVALSSFMLLSLTGRAFAQASDCPPDAFCEAAEVAPPQRAEASESETAETEVAVESERQAEEATEVAAEPIAAVPSPDADTLWPIDGSEDVRVTRRRRARRRGSGLFFGAAVGVGTLPVSRGKHDDPSVVLDLEAGWSFRRPSWLSLGVQAGYGFLGDKSLGSDDPDVEYNLRQRSLMGHVFARFKPSRWMLQPYGEALIGFKNVSTYVEREQYLGSYDACGLDGCETIDEYDNEELGWVSSTTWSAGVGAGFDIRFSERDPSVLFGLSVRYLFGGPIDRGAGQDDPLDRGRSDMFLAMLRLGVQF